MLLEPVYIAVSLVSTIIPAIIANGISDYLKNRRIEKRIERAETKSEEEPRKAAPVWDVARLSLERYLDRNLSQLKWIFVAIVIMVGVGFAIILEGILIVYNDPSKLSPAVLASVSGVVTQFIGASLLIIYRSVLVQAKEYVSVLERINSVGMSMQVLDSIEGNETQIKNTARADIAMTLLRSYHEGAAFDKRRARPSTRNSEI